MSGTLERVEFAAPTPTITGRRRIALLGFARTYTDAPFEDPDVCIVGLNELYRHIPRWDIWFELHDTAYLGKTARVEDPNEPERHLAWLRSQPAGNTIFMLRQYADIPASVAYPLERVSARFGRYFTSSIGYMLAWAIEEVLAARRDPLVAEPDEWIGLFGIDLASEGEYRFQRPNAEYLIGFARGLGIRVDVPETSAVLHAPGLYGYDPPAQDAGLVNEHFLTVQLQRADTKRYEAEANMRTKDGVLQTLALLNHPDTRAKMQATPATIAVIRDLIVEYEAKRGQDMADWNAAGGCVEAFKLCLQAMEFRRRGVYVPECDPLYIAPKGSSA